MSASQTRRTALKLAGAAASAVAIGSPARAQDARAIVMGWPVDPQTWDPTARTAKALQSIYKMVFDQPIGQAPDQSLIPAVAKAWALSDGGKSVELDLRDDVLWHDGQPMTSADIRFTYFERAKDGKKRDLANVWRNVTDVETPSPTRAVIRLSQPMPAALSWLAFLANFVVPKHYVEKVGDEEASLKPIGTGPYRMVEYVRNSRIVLEAFDRYWGPKPVIKKVTILIVKDPSSRVAMIQSGQADFMPEVPIREAVRLGAVAGLKSEIMPISRIILLMVRSDKAFADRNVRLAAQHAIDKQALSQAFFAGKAVPLSVVATPGTPGFVPDFKIPYDAKKAQELLAQAGFGPSNPVKITLNTFNGVFTSDYDIARAVAQMWKRVGIDATVEVIENTMYYELNRAGKLPEATLNDWDNAVGDPEMYSGYLLNPKLPFSVWKAEDEKVGKRFEALASVVDYETRMKGYREANQAAAEEAAAIPLLQEVTTFVYKDTLVPKFYQNGWSLPHTWDVRSS